MVRAVAGFVVVVALVVLSIPWRADALAPCSVAVPLVDGAGHTLATAVAALDDDTHELLIRVDALDGYRLVKSQAEAALATPVFDGAPRVVSAPRSYGSCTPVAAGDAPV